MSEQEAWMGPQPQGFSVIDSQARKAFYAALAKAQGAIEGAIKGNTNPHFRSKYADLGAVWDACREQLSDNGLAILQFPDVQTNEKGLFVRVRTIITHSGGHCEEFDLPMPVSKPDAQGIGSAITYARRYALMAAVGIAPEDDDGNAAVQQTGNGAAQQRPASQSNGASKSKASRDLYTELQSDIAQAGDVDELQAWHGKRLNEIQSLPDDWRKSLKERYVQRLSDLEAEASHVAA